MKKVKLNPVERVIAWAGSPTQLAEILTKECGRNVSRQCIEQWKRRKKIPMKHTKLLSKLTGIELIDLIF